MQFADWTLDKLITNAVVNPDVLVRADLIIRTDHVWNPERTELHPIFTYIPRKFLVFWPPNFRDTFLMKTITEHDNIPRGEFIRWLKTHEFTFIM